MCSHNIIVQVVPKQLNCHEMCCTMNNSIPRQKFMSLGLVRYYHYKPGFKLSDDKKDEIVFNEMEWNNFFNYKIIYIHLRDMKQLWRLKIFRILSSVIIVKICPDNSYVNVAYETVSKLFVYDSLITHYTSLFRKPSFVKYYNSLT